MPKGQIIRAEAKEIFLLFVNYINCKLSTKNRLSNIVFIYLFKLFLKSVFLSCLHITNEVLVGNSPHFPLYQSLILPQILPRSSFHCHKHDFITKNRPNSWNRRPCSYLKQYHIQWTFEKLFDRLGTHCR